MKEYKAGIYLRLSKEDTNTNNSIEAQRDITINYAKAHDFTVVKEYVDNGWSGVLDSRPALNRMIIDIIKKQINMVIVKDLSRLTRDKNKTGYYTEIFFPDNDVRLISVTEFIDSGERYEIDDTIMLRGIMNQSYVADISKKIKSVKTDMKKQGKYVEKNVPYGYKKDDEDKYKVVIDETVSDNVKLIYEMYLQGCSQGEIAKHLTKLKIDTPKKYKGQNVTINEWRNDSISRILKDPFYTGKMIINKMYTDYRTKKKYKTPKKEWIFKENTHEALISQEKFDNVQQMLEEKFNKPQNEYEYLLKGLVYCGHCKSRMQYKYRTRSKIRNKILEEPQKCWYYKCRMIYKFPDICNKGHTIMENT
ncbi:MAG: recombinase family protein [Clostridia bacterium]